MNTIRQNQSIYGRLAAGISFPVFGLTDQNDIGTLIQHIFNFAVTIVGLIIFLRIIQGGYYYFGSSLGATENKGSQIVRDALIGGLLLFSSYFILNIINPDLVKTNLFDLRYISSQIPKLENVEYTASKTEEHLDQVGVTVDASIKQGMPQYVVTSLENVKSRCDSAVSKCQINISGYEENVKHPENPGTTWKKITLSPSASFYEYVTTSGFQSSNYSTGGFKYNDSKTGATYYTDSPGDPDASWTMYM